MNEEIHDFFNILLCISFQNDTAHYIKWENNSERFTILKNNTAWECDMLTNSGQGAGERGAHHSWWQERELAVWQQVRTEGWRRELSGKHPCRMGITAEHYSHLRFTVESVVETPERWCRVLAASHLPLCGFGRPPQPLHRDLVPRWCTWITSLSGHKSLWSAARRHQVSTLINFGRCC